MNRKETIQQLIEQIITTLRALRASFRPSEAQKLSRAEMHLLIRLAHVPKGMSAGELAELESISGSAITQFVDKLVAKGFIERITDPNDRRGVRIHLTPKAREQFQQFQTQYVEQLLPLFNDFSDAELTQFISLWQKIKLPSVKK